MRLVRWRILEATFGAEGELPTRHFVGADARDETGRVSSSILELDVVTRRGLSLSGRGLRFARRFEL